MRNKNEILKECQSNKPFITDVSEIGELYHIRKNQKLILEVLLDIRDSQLKRQKK